MDLRGLNNSRPGHSLLEMVLVLAIIAILVQLGMPVAQIVVVRSHEKALQKALETIRQALDQYRENQRLVYGDGRVASYPRTLHALLTEKDVQGGHFLREIPALPYYGTLNWEVRSGRRPYSGTDDDWRMLATTTENPFGAGHEIYDVRFPKGFGQGPVTPFFQAIDGSFYYDW